MSNPETRGSHAHASGEWRHELPTLASRLVTLREPFPHDLPAIADLLAEPDACRFGIDGQAGAADILNFIERRALERAAGSSFTYAVLPSGSCQIVGLVRVRQLDRSFESAEWEATITPAARGTGVFLEAIRLVASFAFHTVGVHRLEARVAVQNGRANGALEKVGAVQEGILRRSLKQNGQYVDQVLWSVLKEDWGTHWAAIQPRVH